MNCRQDHILEKNVIPCSDSVRNPLYLIVFAEGSGDGCCSTEDLDPCCRTRKPEQGCRSPEHRATGVEPPDQASGRRTRHLSVRTPGPCSSATATLAYPAERECLQRTVTDLLK